MIAVLVAILLAAGPHLYKVRRGDDPARIAKVNHLHAAECGRAILTGNAIADARNLEIGKEIMIPLEVKHVVKAGESVSDLAKQYYHAGKGARLIQECNGLSGEKLSVGSTVYVPIFERDEPKRQRDVATLAAPAPATPTPTLPIAAAGAASAKEDTHAELAVTAAPASAAVPSTALPPPAADAPVADEDSPNRRMRTAMKSYRDGVYDDACRELERLLGEPRLGNDERASVIEYCGYCAVAYGNIGAARDYFRRWLELKPSVQLDPIQTSPKVLDAVEQARRDIRKPSGD